MSADKRVVFTLFRRGEGTYAVQLAVSAERFAPSRQYLVSVGLMAHIPHDAIIRRIIDIMQGNGQLYYAQARRQVSRVH